MHLPILQMVTEQHLGTSVCSLTKSNGGTFEIEINSVLMSLVIGFIYSPPIRIGKNKDKIQWTNRMCFTPLLNSLVRVSELCFLGDAIDLNLSDTTPAIKLHLLYGEVRKRKSASRNEEWEASKWKDVQATIWRIGELDRNNSEAYITRCRAYKASNQCKV